MMRLLFDQNISYRIIGKIEKYFPEAKQVRELGLENYSDIQIWEYAKKNSFSIVTFDSDFFEFANLYGHPPKVIWLRTGNRKTNDLAKMIVHKYEIIQEFVANDNYKEIACIEIE